jgi:hypothetical protein
MFCQARTRALKQEAEHIPRDKRLRKPLPPHQRIPFSVNKENDPTEYDVNRSCKQGWSDKNEQRLHDEGTESPDIVV